jgi:uncharacterized repeat protein (TIGR03803 family)
MGNSISVCHKKIIYLGKKSSSMKRISLLGLLFLTIVTTNAQNGFKYTILHTFNDTAGAYPYGTLAVSGAQLYGTTDSGGAQNEGCIFMVDTNGNGFQDLHDFNDTNGAHPVGTLTISGDTMFGTALLGGKYNAGCLFSIQTNGTEYRDLLDFDTADGSYPNNGLALSGTTLYGSTYSGGTYNYGRIFSIQTDGNGYNDILDFNGANGANPTGTLALHNDTLYSMTHSGGASGDGCIFSIQTNGSNYTDWWDFITYYSKPDQTCSITLASSGNWLYGFVNDYFNGGSRLFGLNTTTDSLTWLSLFAHSSLLPTGSVILDDSILYGIQTNISDSGTYGIIFNSSTINSTHPYNDIFKFNLSTGIYPHGSLVYAGHAFFGTTSAGPGNSGYGVVFKLQDSAYIPAGINSLRTNTVRIIAYPNPTTGVFNIVIPNENHKFQIEIYNILGEKIYKYKIKTDTTQINLDKQSKGIYFYRILNEDGSVAGQGKIMLE